MANDNLLMGVCFCVNADLLQVSLRLPVKAVIQFICYIEHYLLQHNINVCT